MSLEQQKNVLVRFAFAAVILLLAFLLLKFTVAVFLPFLAAFLIAALLDRPIRCICEKTGLARPLAAVPVIVLFFGAAGALFVFLGVRAFALVNGLFANLPGFYTAAVEPAVYQIMGQVQRQIAALDPSALAAVNEVAASLVGTLSGLVSNASFAVIGAVSGVAALVPGAFLNILITVIVTFFVALDYRTITGFLARQLPEKARAMTLEVKDYVGGTLIKCILSYGLIMAITFLELAIGLSLLGVPHAAMIALGIAVFDILPVLGTGGIMIPWAILTAVLGDYGLALGLLAVYLVITVVRNIIEPRIVGHQVGLHPVVTLASMLAGLHCFGVVGLFGFPIALSLLKNLNDRGVIHLFR